MLSSRLLLIALALIAAGLAAEAAAPALRREGPRGGGGGEGRRGKGRGRKGGGRRRAPPMAVTVNPDPMPCRPRNASVPLPPAPPGKLYLPNCAVVERCSGCCSVDSIECVPKPGAKVAKTKWKTNEYILDNGQWRFNEVVSFDIEKHTKCTCGCKIRAEHCSVLQSYDSSSCRCSCTNHEESLLCDSPRYWDVSSCSCKCPSSTLDCSTGSFMDPHSCRCITVDKIFQMVMGSSEAQQPDIYRL